MILQDLLFEDRASFIATAAGNKLVQLAQQETNQQYAPQQIVAQLAKGDPTKNQQYLQWITNQYLKKQFRLEDMSRIHDELSKFDKVKNKLDIKDINKYDYHALSDQVDKIFNQASIEQEPTTSNDIKDVKVLYNGPLGTLSIPLTQEASCELGKGTKWCTAANKNNLFNTYNKEGPLYIWRDKSGEKYQFHFGGSASQLMDDKDRPISDKLLTQFRLNHPVLSKLFKQQEQEIMKDPRAAFSYAHDAIKGRWPEAEPYIMKDPMAIGWYARDIIKGRWLEAEPYIMKDPKLSRWYQNNVIDNFGK